MKRLRWLVTTGYARVWDFEHNNTSRVIRVRSDYNRLYALPIATGFHLCVGYYPESSQGPFELVCSVEWRKLTQVQVAIDVGFEDPKTVVMQDDRVVSDG